MFFWDMNEKKHREIMEVLKVRTSVQDGIVSEQTGRELEEKILSGDEFAWKNYMEENGIEDSLKESEKTDENVAPDDIAPVS